MRRAVGGALALAALAPVHTQNDGPPPPPAPADESGSAGPPCCDTVRGDGCWQHVDWARYTGRYERPENYPPALLLSSATQDEFQCYLYSNSSGHHRDDCPDPPCGLECEIVDEPADALAGVPPSCWADVTAGVPPTASMAIAGVPPADDIAAPYAVDAANPSCCPAECGAEQGGVVPSAKCYPRTSKLGDIGCKPLWCAPDAANPGGYRRLPSCATPSDPPPWIFWVVLASILFFLCLGFCTFLRMVYKTTRKGLRRSRSDSEPDGQGIELEQGLTTREVRQPTKHPLRRALLGRVIAISVPVFL